MSEFKNTPFTSVQEEIDHCLRIDEGLDEQRAVINDKQLKNLERLKKLGWKPRPVVRDPVQANQKALLDDMCARNALAAHAQSNAQSATYGSDQRQLSGLGIGNMWGPNPWGVHGK
jgi:hypothetical protein